MSIYQKPCTSYFVTSYLFVCIPVIVLKSLAVVSMEAVATSCFCGSNCTATTSAECPVKVCWHSPESNDHKHAVLSNDPVSILSLKCLFHCQDTNFTVFKD